MYWFCGLIFDGYQQQWVRFPARDQSQFKAMLAQRYPVHVCIWCAKEPDR